MTTLNLILAKKLKENPEDATEAIQFLIDFFRKNSENYYVRNKSFLKSNQLESLLNKINISFDSETLNNKENQKERKYFSENVFSFTKKLNEQSLKYNKELW